MIEKELVGAEIPPAIPASYEKQLIWLEEHVSINKKQEKQQKKTAKHKLGSLFSRPHRITSPCERPRFFGRKSIAAKANPCLNSRKGAFFGILIAIKTSSPEGSKLQHDASRFEQEVIGVALAAGKGSRMFSLPTQLPKPVLPVLDKPIVYHQLTAMAKLGIKKAIILVGHRGYEVVRQIERQPPLGIEIDYVPQETSLGIAHCVGRLEGAIEGPFLLFLGDIYFHAPGLGGMIDLFRETKSDAVLGAIEEEDTEAISRNYRIVTDGSGLARQVIEKPRYPKSNLKGVGIYLFTPVVFDAIRRTSRTALRDEYEITDSIQILIDLGYEARAFTDIVHDLNVTFPRDLLDLNLWALNHEGLDKYVADSAEVGSGAVIETAVVGAGAVIGARAVVRNSVVFAGAHVPEGCELENVIVTESDVCRV